MPLKEMSYILSRVVRESASKSKTRNSNISKSTSHDNLVRLGRLLIHIFPSSARSDMESFTILGAGNRGKVLVE